MAGLSMATGGEAPPPRRRGRKRKEGTLVVNVRIPIAIYDRYCLVAQRARPGPLAVRSVLRHILTIHAPSE